MRRILEDSRYSAAEIILRLAWKLGLRREEMHRLTWRDIDFARKELILPGRRTPIDNETFETLKERFVARRAQSEFVVTSDRHHAQMQPPSISRAARQVLDAGGQEGISLEDLRQDWIIRLLSERGVDYTARVSGMAVDTLYANYSRYLSREPEPEWQSTAEVDEFAVWQVMQKEDCSPVGLVLWLTWQLGLSVKEALELTWEQVDLQNGRLCLRDRQVALSVTFGRMLYRVWADRSPGADPHVLLSPNAQSPYDAPRISKLAKTALLRGGVEGVTLETLSQLKRRKSGDTQLLQQAEKAGCITRNEVMVLLSVTPAQAYERLRRLTEQGKLVKVGNRYYPIGTVVPPEEHYQKIRDYLMETGGAYRQELADILHLEARQCSWILQNLTKEGHLVKEGQRYLLPKNETSKK